MGLYKEAYERMMKTAAPVGRRPPRGFDFGSSLVAAEKALARGDTAAYNNSMNKLKSYQAYMPDRYRDRYDTLSGGQETDAVRSEKAAFNRRLEHGLDMRPGTDFKDPSYQRYMANTSARRAASAKSLYGAQRTGDPNKPSEAEHALRLHNTVQARLQNDRARANMAIEMASTPMGQKSHFGTFARMKKVDPETGELVNASKDTSYYGVQGPNSNANQALSMAQNMANAQANLQLEQNQTAPRQTASTAPRPSAPTGSVPGAGGPPPATDTKSQTGSFNPNAFYGAPSWQGRGVGGGNASSFDTAFSQSGGGNAAGNGTGQNRLPGIGAPSWMNQPFGTFGSYNLSLANNNNFGGLSNLWKPLNFDNKG